MTNSQSELQNTCAEAAIQAAVGILKPGVRAEFTKNGVLSKDFQIDLSYVFSRIPGEHDDWDNIQSADDISAKLSKLNPNKIYFMRKGEILGAGHYGYLHYDKPSSIWKLFTGPNRDFSITHPPQTDAACGAVIDGIYESEFKHLHYGKERGDYSVSLDEINEPRAIAAMNYIAAFRNFSQHEDNQESASIATNEWFDTTLLNQDIFLNLSDIGKNYWQISGDTIDLADVNNQHKTSVYRFLAFNQNLPAYLDKLIAALPDGVNHQFEEGQTLLHLAMLQGSKVTFDKLLENGANLESKNAQGKTVADIYRERVHVSPEAFTQFFDLLEIENAIETGAKSEFSELLIKACEHNHVNGVETLLEHGCELPDNNCLLEGLLDTKNTLGFGWDTVEDCLFTLAKHVAEKSPAQVKSFTEKLRENGYDFDRERPFGGDENKKTLNEILSHPNCDGSLEYLSISGGGGRVPPSTNPASQLEALAKQVSENTLDAQQAWEKASEILEKIPDYPRTSANKERINQGELVDYSFQTTEGKEIQKTVPKDIQIALDSLYARYLEWEESTTFTPRSGR